MSNGDNGRSTKSPDAQSAGSRRAGAGNGSGGDNGRGRARLRAREAADRAVEELTDLLGVEPYGVVGVERLGSTWQVLVEVVELERVPDTTNIIGEYSVDLDDGGELVGYRRTGRYVRGRAEEG